MSAPQPRSSPASSFWESRTAFAIGSVILLGALIAAYANSFRVPFLLDDGIAITDNETIRSLSSAWLPPATSGVTTSGRPLLNVSLAINYAIHGTDVFGYHVVNLLIHFLGALTLRAVVRRTLLQPVLASRFAHHATPLAWCAAALWALHPLQTESVTYIVQRAESLVSLFYLLTLYGFIRSTENVSALSAPSAHPAATALPHKRFWSIFTATACLAGMASKEVMASAPLIIFLYDRTFISGTFAAAWRSHRKLHLSFAATWLMLLACIIQSGGRGSTVGFLHITWWEYALVQTSAITGYLWRALWPANLIFDYGAIVKKNPAVVIPGVLFIFILLGLAIYALRRRPVIGFAFAWLFLILAPTSSIIPVATQTIAEHRMYLPLAAVTVSATLLLYLAKRPLCWFALTSLLIASGVRTHIRNHDYRSSLAIWEDTVRRVPDSIRALNNLGSMLSQDGRVEESIAHFEDALSFAPHYAEAHHNLGSSFFTLKRYPEAVTAFERALTLDPDNALYVASLGNTYAENGQLEKALPLYRRAYELKPGLATNACNLANTLMRLDHLDEAGPLFQSAIALAPDDTEIINNYATWLRRSDRPADAIPLLEKTIRLSPDSGRLHSNLGVCLTQAGRKSDGIRELEIALQSEPNLPQTRYHLGSAYAETGRPADAIPQFEALLKLSAPNAELLDNLGVLYAQTGRYTEAIATFQRALQLDPTHRNARQNLEATQDFLRNQNRR